ncbi:MAG: glucose-1-phosphate cytidylyltransferase [Deltaproteobacteria bacterium]|nr:glucose-1-phosphate cytidylyltransferase [Deltaproteobacteria bacterium]
MKVIILAGGFGTRMSEETSVIPKPMVPIGNKPILWHIMKTYSHYGFNDFVVLLGYKGDSIKNFFLNYYTSQSDICIDLNTNSVDFLESRSDPWSITLLETGPDSLTGSRIKLAEKVINNQPFMLTYGDGVSDINIPALIECHQKSRKLATLSSVQPEGRFGSLGFGSNGEVISFNEKIAGDGSWINAGFFVCEPEVFGYIGEGSRVTFEREPLEKLARDGQLNSYKHNGYWKCMDTLSDKMKLNEIWNTGHPPWRVWSEP